MNIKNIDGYRKCSSCKKLLPLTSALFYKAKSRYLGFEYRCKFCTQSRDFSLRRRLRYHQLSDVEKRKRLDIDKRYRQTINGKAIILFNASRTTDRIKKRQFDLDKDFIKSNILNRPCVYCEMEGDIGIERIDNSIGHIKSNVVPACKYCNIARMDNFTHEEMFILGKTIREIKLKRISDAPHYELP